MEQNNVSPEKKDTILKSLAIAGFIGILILVAWLSIQLVHLFPATLSSLASLAEGVGDNQESVLDTNPEPAVLTVTANSTLIDSGDEIEVTWSDVQSAGSYVFSFECAEGVAVTQLSTSGDRVMNCDTNYNVGDIESLTIAIDSEKNRYTDVAYTLAFLRTEDETPRATGGNIVTVVNTDIDSLFAAQIEQSDETEPVTDVTEAPVVEETPTPTPTPEPALQYVQEYIYTIPVSDPNGTVDLASTFVDTGVLIDGQFFPGPMPADATGAIQFEVKNIGTKTSRSWSYTVTLPESIYESETQAALQPNERAILTIGFPTNDDTFHTFEVETATQNDRNNQNNTFQYFVIYSE